MGWSVCWPVSIVLVIAVCTDLHSRRIPNWLVLPFLLVGPALYAWQQGWGGLRESLLGMLLGGFVMGIFVLKGGMGMGDLKLCAALGAWLGPSQLLTALVMMALIGGVMALIWATVDGFLKELFLRVICLLMSFKQSGLRPHGQLKLSGAGVHAMPYAPAIAVGTLLSFLSLSH